MECVLGTLWMVFVVCFAMLPIRDGVSVGVVGAVAYTSIAVVPVAIIVVVVCFVM